jgi:uncharacterized protein DUF6415
MAKDAPLPAAPDPDDARRLLLAKLETQADGCDGACNLLVTPGEHAAFPFRGELAVRRRRTARGRPLAHTTECRVTSTTEMTNGTAPVDLETMGETGSGLLDPDAVSETLPPAADELGTLILQLRGHLDLLMPEVEQVAKRLPKDSIPTYCAFACLGEARDKLRAEPSPAPGGDLAYARRLARVLAALCDHFEVLGKTAP